ncbi:MAG: CPBP family intramembrane metalloprotease [Phycisphaerae bacterium]|nr:CPBP family intramembrane metalloprotease [Phycisphaerae bacterium]
MLNTVIAGVAPETLDFAAEALFVAGLAVVLLAMVVHWRREGLDPLAGSRVRGNRITPLPAIVPFCGWVFASALLHSLWREWGEGTTTEAVQLGINSVGQAVGVGLCLWVGARCFRGGWRGFLLGGRGILHPVGMAVVYLLAAGALCELTLEATERIFLLFDPAYAFHEHRVLEALRDPAEPAWAPGMLWIGTVLITPLAEECFFRGMLQTLILRLTRMRWVAVLVTAVLFGLAHQEQPQVVPALTLFGIILGIQYERSGGLIGPIALHAMFNLKTLIWQWLITGAAGG